MPFILKQVGGNVKVIDINGENLGYFDRSQIECNFNPLDKTVSVTMIGNTVVTLPAVTPGGILTINTVIGGAVDITTEALFDTNYSLLFPKLGGGSGSTPNLQQVTNIGNTTTTDIITENTTAGTPVRAKLKSNAAKNSGSLELKRNNAGNNTAEIFAENMTANRSFQIPNPVNDNLTLVVTINGKSAATDGDVNLIEQERYTPSFSGLSANIDSVTITEDWYYSKTLQHVYVFGSFTIDTNNLTTGENLVFKATLPIATNLTIGDESCLSGTGCARVFTDGKPCVIYPDLSTDPGEAIFKMDISSPAVVRYNFNLIYKILE